MAELPPRAISAGTKKSLFFSSPFMWCGLIFLFVGLILTLVFGASADLKSPFYFSSSDPVVEGTLLGKEQTNSSVNKKKIYAYRYRYAVGGQPHEGRSFAINNGAGAGDSVEVQYAPDKPGRSRLSGQRLAPFGWWVLAFALIFPVGGLVILYFTVGQYRKYLYLLRNGVLASGKVTRKIPTSTKINGSSVCKVFFQFQTPDGGMHEASVACLDTARLGDEEREPLVYDANNPASAVLLDALPPKVRVLLAAV